MKDLKFRVWYGKEFVYFNLCDTNRYPSNVMQFPVNQYTGLNDNTGNPIYDGDIVTYYNKYSGQTYTREVRWDYLFACFGLFDKDNEWCQESDWVKIVNVEIIGNVFEHKHLLK